MKKSIILHTEKGCVLKHPKKYRHLLVGDGYWTKGLLRLFKYSKKGNSTYKFITDTTEFIRAKRVTDLQIYSEGYSRCTINDNIYQLPCKKALNIFFNQRIPDQFYLRIDKIK
jgi:hypothetical protein